VAQNNIAVYSVVAVLEQLLVSGLWTAFTFKVTYRIKALF